MKLSHRFFAMFGAVILGGACSEPTSTTIPTLTWFDETGAAAVAAPPGAVTVMSQNLYVGADVDVVIRALASPDPSDDVPALLEAIQTLAVTDFPTRAGALAGTIAAERPQVVGLQEVSVIDIDLTPLGLPVVIHQDFLATLQADLATRGLHYAVAAQVQNITAQPLPGIQLVDYDVLLVDTDRATASNGAGHTFAANIGVVAPGVELKRGWVSADVTIAGRTYAIASTHLESGQAPGLAQLRAAQAQELAGSLPADRPAIVLGDMNDTPGSPMYQVLTGAQLGDAWGTLRPDAPGFTCCETADLSNPVPQLVERIDYVFTRLGETQRPGEIHRIGEVPADRVPVGGPAFRIWPSDHAGVVLEIWARR